MISGKKRKYLAIAIITLSLFILGKSWHDTMSDPVVRKTQVALPGLNPFQPPLRLVLLSDIHVAGPDMPPARLTKIIAQINALKPDYVLIAGDLVSDRKLSSRSYSLQEAIAPLAGLTPRIGTIAVLGNHDHWRDAAQARSLLLKTGASVLNNQAIRIGPITFGGLDDDFTRHADPESTLAAMRKIGPPFVMLSHSPDPFPAIPKDVPLMVAGHTHCWQVKLPLIGGPVKNSRFGDRYACGRIVEAGKVLVVSAGLGVSVLPFRFGTVPDIWLITVNGK